MMIGDWDLEEDVLVIAEIGNNHEGDCQLAEEMLFQAAEAGVGAVKFQTIVPERLVSPSETDRIQQLKRFQLRYEEFEELQKAAEKADVLFLATPFDIESAHFLEPLVPSFKIASGDNNFYPLIDIVARFGKPILVSAGMADMGELFKTRNLIQGIWDECGITQELAVLHCVSSYPTPTAEANLAAIRTLKDQLGVTVGYSDHTLGIEAAVLSVTLGARIIEKHFTLDKNYSDFHDHELAADPKDMAELVRRVKEALNLLGDGDKLPQESEKVSLVGGRRSIVAGHDLLKGQFIEWEDLDWLRPGTGLPPGKENQLLGRKLRRHVLAGTKILPEDLAEI